MDTQNKLLDKNYIVTRVQEIKEIRTKELGFEIYNSDRKQSKSIYVSFYSQNANGARFKGHTLRISDHLVRDCPHSQFIVCPNEYLTKKVKEKFMRSLQTTIRKTKTKSLNWKLDKMQIDTLEVFDEKDNP